MKKPLLNTLETDIEEHEKRELQRRIFMYSREALKIASSIEPIIVNHPRYRLLSRLIHDQPFAHLPCQTFPKVERQELARAGCIDFGIGVSCFGVGFSQSYSPDQSGNAGMLDLQRCY